MNEEEKKKLRDWWKNLPDNAKRTLLEKVLSKTPDTLAVDDPFLLENMHMTAPPIFDGENEDNTGGRIPL